MRTFISLMILAVVFTLSSQSATAKTEKKGDPVTVATWSKTTGKVLMRKSGDLKAFTRGLAEAMPEFKTTAVRDTKIVCQMSLGGLQCLPEESGTRCPTVIEIPIPGEKGSAQVDVDCEGPDANGDCECEVAGSK